MKSQCIISNAWFLNRYFNTALVREYSSIFISLDIKLAVSPHKLIGAIVLGFISICTAMAGPEPVQYFYLPLPEASVQRTLVELQPGRTVGQTMNSVTSITTTRDTTIIYYDHWENGYEVDIANPVNLYSASNPGGTQVWGDGDPSNGIPPGFATDVIDADAVIALDNLVQTPRNTSTILFDGRDKLASTKAIAMTRAQWATNPGTVLAGAIEVYSTGFLGTDYEFPIGEDLASASNQMFQYVSVFVMATEDGATVEIDLDGDSVVDATRTLNEGENYFANGVETGGTVSASANIQVHLITGNLSNSGGNLEARWYTQLPVNTWSNEYYNPVGSSGSNQPTQIFLYNPNATAINVDYETFVSSGTINVPAGGTAQYTMPSSSGAVFKSQSGEEFFGVANVAAGPSNGGSSGSDNDTWDWGFSLVPEEILTPQVVVGWGPGADDRDGNGSPDAQGSPVWVAVTDSTVVYVDYDGDASTGPNTDPNGNRYDLAFNLNRLQQTKVYDNNDNDQTGMKLYTVDGTLITAAWGQDPSTAGAGNPYLDLGTTVPPFPFPQLIKTAQEVADGDGVYEPGDTVEYTISVTNLGAVPLADLILSDELPSTVSYVEDTLEVGGVAQADDPTGTAFPLDGDGIILPIIGVREELLIVFQVTLDPAAAGNLVNTAILDIGPEVLIADTLSSSSSIDVVNNRVAPDIEFTDSGFSPVALYNEGDDIYVQLEDADLNVSVFNADSFTVVVMNDDNGDFELLDLVETGPNTSIFQGGPLGSTPGGAAVAQDGVLKMSVGDTISVSATDPGDPVGLPNSDSDTAFVPVPTNEKILYLSTDGADNDTTGYSDRINPSDPDNLDTTTSYTAAPAGLSELTAVGTSSSATNGNSNTLTFSHTVADGPDRLLVVGVALGGNDVTDGTAVEAVQSVTFNGQSLQLLSGGAISDPGATPVTRSEIWYLVNPPATTGNVVVTLQNSSTRSFVAGATTFWGANQLTPFGTPVADASDDDGNQTSVSMQLTGVDTDDIGYSVIAWDEQDSSEAEVVSVGASQDLLWREDADNPDDVAYGVASTIEGGGTLDFSYTTNSVSGEWAGVVVPIRQAGTLSLDNVSTGFANDSFSSITVPHTTASEANRLMVVTLSWQDDDTPNRNIDENSISISYNGDTGFTRAGIQQGGPGNDEDWAAIYYMTAPDTGSHDVVVSVTGAESGDSMAVGVTTFYGVDQAQPLRTSPATFTGADGPDGSTSSTIDVTSAEGEVVMDLITIDDGDQLTSANVSQTTLYLNNSPANVSSGVSLKAGASSVSMNWIFEGDEYCHGAIAIRPASTSTNALVFTQNPGFAADFNMPQGGAISATAYIDSLTGVLPGTAAVTAELSYGSNPPFATFANATYNSGVGTLTWSGVLSSDVTVPTGESIILTITNYEPGTSFRVAYDSNTYPSYISLPAETVVDVENLEVYDAPYPNGNLVADGYVGQKFYIRTTISDPFGTSDITDPSIQITDPNSNTLLTPDPSMLASVGTLIDSDAASLTYEYEWQTPATDGAYTVTVSADEGTEGTVSDTLQTTITLAGVDGGTPSTIYFTTGDDGPDTDSYTSAESIGVRLVDYDENEDPGAIDTVQVTITTSSGDSDVVTLVETGVNTGIFTAVFPSATDSTNADDGDINAGSGTGLTVTYFDDDDPTDGSQDQAAVPFTTPNTAGVVVDKVLVQPSDGDALVGDQVTYNITVINVGNVALDTIELLDEFDDSELAFVSSSVTPDSTPVVGSTRTLTWNDIGGLEVGESATITVVYTSTGSGSISSTATANATSAFNDPSDSDTEVLTVTNPAITITKVLEGGAQTAYYGNLVEFTITIENTGDTAIETLPFTDNYSSCLQLLASTPAADSSGGGVAQWNDLLSGASTLGAGASTQITMTFLVVGECSPALNVGEVRYAIDVNGDPVPPADDENEALTTDAASVSGTVWQDDDSSGVQNGAEVGLPSVRVYTDLDGDGSRDANEPFDITDASGDYRIGNLAEGSYTVRIDDNFLDDALSITTPASGNYSLTLTPGEDAEADFGLELTSVAGLIFNDVDGDGDTTPGGGENGIGGVDVVITDSQGNVQTIRTLADGTFTAEVAPGIVWVNVDESSLPAGYALTTDMGVDNEPQSLTAAAGVNNFTSIGYQQPQGVAGHLFIDLDGNGTQDPGEPDLSGVTVFYDANSNGTLDGGEASDVSDSAGDYVISIPMTGSVTIKVDTSTLPSGMSATATTGNDPQSVTVNASATSLATDIGFEYTGLGILKTSNVTNDVEPGDTITYKVLVSNNTGSTHTGIDIRDTLPADVTYVANSLSVNSPLTYTQTASLNITEDFESQDETGGSPAATSNAPGWLGDWFEMNESNGFDTDDIEIANDDSAGTPSWSLLIESDDKGAGRGVDLSLATSATIDFTYRRVSLNFGDDDVDVQISATGGAPWTTLGTYGDGVNDADYIDQGAPINISNTFFTENTVIRFFSDTGILEDDDWIHFDDIVIAVNYTETLSQTGTQGNFPTNDEIGNDFTLNDGQSIIITYKVKVVDEPAGATISNTASVSSDQQPAAIDSTVTNDVYDPAQGIVSGYVLEDTSGDGNGNIGIENVTIELLDSSGDSIDSDTDLPGVQITVTTTDSDGAYSFEEVTPGSYQVRQTQPSGYLSVASADDGGDVNILGDVTLIDVTDDATTTGNNFIEQKPATISGFVYEDYNADGLGDIGIAGVVLELLDASGASIDSDAGAPGVQATTTTTNVAGQFFFNDLTPGVTYQVRQVQPAGYQSVGDSDGGLPNRIGDVTPITVSVGLNLGHYFTEELLPGSISGTVYDDTDGDGVGDTGIDGVRVFIDRNGNGVFDGVDIEVTTAGGGAYSFGNLRAGYYQIVAEDASGYVSVSDSDGGDASITNISLGAGVNETGIDFVDGLPATISGQVRDDTDGDGDFGDADSGLALATVEIYEDLNQNGLVDFNESLVASTTTDGTGNFSFEVPAGDYVLLEADPSNYLSTADSDGANDNQIGLAVSPNVSSTSNVFLDANQGPNLVVSKTLDGGATTVNYGASVSYTITINNNGNTSFDTVPLADTFSSTQLEYVSASPLPSSTADGSLTWNDLGVLAIGETHTVTVNFIVIGEGSPVTNTATVTDAEDEFGTLISGSDSDSLLTSETASISGQVWEDDDGDGVFDGGEAGFSGVVTVYADLNSNGVRDASEPNDTVDGSGNYTINNLAAGTYRIRVDENTLPSGTNYSISFPVSPANPYYDVTVTAAQDVTDRDFGYEPQIGDLTITKFGANVSDVDGGPVNPGETITYTITVTNNDSVTHTGIDVTDVLPGGVSYVPSSVNVTAPANYTSGTTTTNITESWTTGTYTSGSAVGNPGWNAASWSEFGDGGGASGGEVLVQNFNSNPALKVENGVRGVTRAINLSALSATDTATLNFDWGATNINFNDDEVVLEIRENGSASWTELARVGGANQSPLTSVSTGISNTYFTATAQFRISGTNGLDNNDLVYIDNIDIETVQTITSPQPGVAGDPSALATGYALDPGDSMTIEFQVIVDGPMPSVALIQNTAELSSDQQPGPISATEFNAVNVGSISGKVLADTDGNGVGDVAMSGIVITLRNDDGSTIDTDSGTPGVQEPEATTNSLGEFTFENVPLGDYQVVQLIQPAGYISVGDTDGSNNTVNNTVGDETALSLASNGDSLTEILFIEAQYGSISGTVYDDQNLDGDFDAGEPGLANATIDLILDANANGEIDGSDIVYASPATSDGSGDYTFANVPVGRYIIRETDPAGYYSTSDDDGANDNLIITGIVVTSGGSISSNTSFYDASASGNEDGDCYPDFLELALNGDTTSGVISTGLMQLTLINESTGRFDVVFTRPDGLLNVSYTLQGANDLLSGWFDIATISANAAVSAPYTSVDNGGTETVTYGNIQTAPGFSSADFGLVRLAITTGATTLYTDVYGWQATQLELAEANSWSTPFIPQELFCGVVDDMLTANSLDLSSVANGADFGALIGSGDYFVEVTDGVNEGHRFQIASGDTNSVTLVTDSDIYSPDGGDYLNTSNTIPDLTGADIKIRRFTTFGELFKKDSTFDGQESDDPNLATHIYFYDNRRAIPEYEAIMLADYQDPFASFIGVPVGSRWVKENDFFAAEDQGPLVIDPATGFVIISRQEASKLYSYGKVRSNDAAVLLNDNGDDPSIAGFNLVGALYPTPQVPIDGPDSGQNGRGLTASVLPAGNDPDNAAEILLWPTDPEVEGRTSVFFLLGSGEDTWVDYAEVGGPPYTNLNDAPNTLQFRSDRASLIKMPEGSETVVIMPEPTP